MSSNLFSNDALIVPGTIGPGILTADPATAPHSMGFHQSFDAGIEATNTTVGVKAPSGATMPVNFSSHTFKRTTLNGGVAGLKILESIAERVDGMNRVTGVFHQAFISTKATNATVGVEAPSGATIPEDFSNQTFQQTTLKVGVAGLKIVGRVVERVGGVVGAFRQAFTVTKVTNATVGVEAPSDATLPENFSSQTFRYTRLKGEMAALKIEVYMKIVGRVVGRVGGIILDISMAVVAPVASVLRHS
ncbi:hypothetical protein MSAN_00841400 [Mycena sanguinolenta]|uniref:Uncharacterized protein n=1 Tax=Mycena sanguinolenta TaxID=230812 RepID=A0A8H6YVB1_9AGAR|nr:hypothetical protein MSAN_00841400 [Mycena sanguinolenta]